MHNEGVPSSPRFRLRLVVPGIVTVLGLSGCSQDSDRPTPAADSSSPASSPASSPPSASASPAVQVPEGTELTDQGSTLAYGDRATVAYERAGGRGTVLQLVVRRVQRGRLSDFAGFILDDSYTRKAAYYYATVSVRNVGTRDLGGVAVPLWGVNAAKTLLPAVRFTTRFARCPSVALPARFPPGASFDTCLVYLSPNRGALTSVSYRPTQQYDPVTWTGELSAPPAAKPARKPASKPARKPAKKPAGKPAARP